MPKGVDRIHPNLTSQAYATRRATRMGQNPHMIVEMARGFTKDAIRKLVSLMNGNGGTAKVLDKNGVLVEIDIEVPATVQAKCAELLIERGYGKAPQAILLGLDDKGDNRDALPIAERILLLKAARESAGNTTDLEASEQREIEVLELTTSPAAEPGPNPSTSPSPQDLI